ncbi:MAG TPA: HEAT repeat domain-containing protein [Phycisphaerales bacterium]|nr:HEAT repeat domain-containing protein [Phycisphaerales bacterium]
MHTQKFRAMAMIGVAGGALGLLCAGVPAGCSADGGATTTSRRGPTRSEKPRAAEPEVVTPRDTGPVSPRIKPFSAAERASLRERAITLLSNTAQAGSPEERANALEGLVQVPTRLAGVAEIALKDPNPGVRAVAAMSIGKAKLTALAPRLRPLAQDENPFVRAGALFALKQCGAPVDITPLAGMLFDTSAGVRAHAAYILGELGEKSAIGPLREAHKVSSGRASQTAVRLSDLQLAEARVKLGDDSALADIRAALYPAKPEDLEAAALAVQIVGQIKDAVSINRLIELTAQADPGGQDMPGEIRMAAAASLARLGQPHGSYIAREYFQGGKETLRAQAASLFGETKRPENLQLVSRLMDDPDGRVRVAAAAAVIKITDRAAE